MASRSRRSGPRASASKPNEGRIPALGAPAGIKRSTKRLHPTLVFARFHLRAQRLKVRFAIDHPFRSA
jgi:hypothetical protein